MDIITLKVLKKAIKNRMQLSEEDAIHEAEVILDFFGFQDRIIDNILEPKERQFFYELEKAGILTSAREIIYLSSGREWRLHYWLVNKKKIIQYAQEKNTLKKEDIIKKQTVDSVYNAVTAAMWNTRKITE